MKTTQAHPPATTDKDPGTVVDRASHEPAYVQICTILKNQITRGEYLPGQRLPSESTLCRMNHVSPMTVRRSIKLLIDQGVVTTVQGSGTFVSKPDIESTTFSLKGFYGLFKDRKKTKVKLLEVKTMKADEDAAAKLQVNVGDRIILLSRILLREGDPIIYHREYLVYDPTRPSIEWEMEINSLHGLFERTGQTNLKRGHFTVEAMVLNQEEADRLGTMALQPAFRLEHVFYDFDEAPFSWGQFICRGDQLRFEASVGF
ncbi:MAG: GntR family transcriptional regulator [Pseudomonadota bacterium]